MTLVAVARRPAERLSFPVFPPRNFTNREHNPMRHLICAVAALALVLAAPVRLIAAPRSETSVVRIRIGDLDLSRDSGMAAFNARMDAAADRVCMQLAQGRILLRSERQACRGDVRQQVAEHLGALQPDGPVFAAALTADRRWLAGS
jgi:UrcA family protein